MKFCKLYILAIIVLALMFVLIGCANEFDYESAFMNEIDSKILKKK